MYNMLISGFGSHKVATQVQQMLKHINTKSDKSEVDWHSYTIVTSSKSTMYRSNKTSNLHMTASTSTKQNQRNPINPRPNAQSDDRS